MPFTINYNPEAHIIQIKVKENVTLDEFKEIFSQGVQMAKGKECYRILSDFSEATNINLSTLEIYDIPKIVSGIAASSGIHASRLKRAIVTAPHYTDDARFAENVISNAGQISKFFHDIEDAKKWLLGK